MKKIISILTLSAIVLISCKKKESEETIQTEPIAIEKPLSNCFYTVDSTKTSVKWTAFKTSEKIGVGGQFNTIEVSGIKQQGTSIADALSTLKFSINTSSTNTNNEDRDKKIVNFFFGNMAKTNQITGFIKQSEGNNINGNCIAQLRMNDIENEVKLAYTYKNDTVQLLGTIDVTNWKGNKALSAINEACKALHTGADGKSITWPNVDVNIQAIIKRDCE